MYKQNNWVGWVKLTAWSHKRKFPPVQGCRSKGRDGAVCGLGLQPPDALVLWSFPVRGLEEGP